MLGVSLENLSLAGNEKRSWISEIQTGFQSLLSLLNVGVSRTLSGAETYMKEYYE